MSVDHSDEYEALKDEGAEGLTQSQAYEFLCNIGQNPTGLDFLDYKKKAPCQCDHDPDLFCLKDLDELNKSLGNPEEKLRKAFAVYDHNNDGFVDKEELRELLAATDIYDAGLHSDSEFWESYWEDTLKHGDTNNDGKLSIDELVELLLQGGVTF